MFEPILCSFVTSWMRQCNVIWPTKLESSETRQVDEPSGPLNGQGVVVRASSIASEVAVVTAGPAGPLNEFGDVVGST